MKLFIILFILPIQICAQDITGLWSGHLYNDTTRKYLPYELVISEDKDKLNGFSHAIILIDTIENIAVKTVQIKKRNGKILVEDEAFIYNNFTISPPKGVRVFSNMIYRDVDSAEVLTGEWNTNPTNEYSALTGSIRLQKQKDFNYSKLIAKLHELDLSNSLSFLPVKKEKEVLAIASDPDQVKKKSEPDAIKKEEIKDISIAVPVRVLSPDLQRKPEEVVLTSSTSSIQKSKFIPRPKEKPSVIAPPEIVKKSPPVSQPEVKEKQIVIISPPPTIKNQPVSQPKQPEKKEVVVSLPQSPPVSQPKQKEKQIVIVSPPPVIKNQPISQPRQPEKKDVVVSLPPPLAKPILEKAPIASAVDLATRKTEMIRSVSFKSDSLVLSLYDNGEIDGDTVSVVMNGKVIMARQGLTANAITKTIYMTPDLGDSLQLIMYAENLGSIPPNTGLLILQDGDDRYEIRFAGDFQKNSAIILRRNR